MNKRSDGIWIIDADATTLYANAAMAEILGIEAARLIGKPSFEYVFPEDAEAAQRLFDMRKRGESAPFHFRLKRADSSAIWVEVQGTPMKNVEGEFIGIVGTFRISERQS
jgi:PAS domain S-box-containing protein